MVIVAQTSNFPPGLFVIAALVALVILGLLVDRLLLWMERRGWIYYRTFEPKIEGGIRGVMGTFQEIVQPEIREVKDDQSRRKAAEASQDKPADQ